MPAGNHPRKVSVLVYEQLRAYSSFEAHNFLPVANLIMYVNVFNAVSILTCGQEE